MSELLFYFACIVCTQPVVIKDRLGTNSLRNTERFNLRDETNFEDTSGALQFEMDASELPNLMIEEGRLAETI